MESGQRIGQYAFEVKGGYFCDTKRVQWVDGCGPNWSYPLIRVFERFITPRMPGFEKWNEPTGLRPLLMVGGLFGGMFAGGGGGKLLIEGEKALHDLFQYPTQIHDLSPFPLFLTGFVGGILLGQEIAWRIGCRLP